jgi:hypothetical protein
LEPSDRELIDEFRAAVKHKSAGQIHRESGIKLTTAKRLKKGGYPKGALKGEVREQMVAYTKAVSGQTAPRGTSPPAPDAAMVAALAQKAAAWDVVMALAQALNAPVSTVPGSLVDQVAKFEQLVTPPAEAAGS